MKVTAIARDDDGPQSLDARKRIHRGEQPLDQIQYWFVWGGVRHFKTVHFYLMQMVGGDTANHDGEYDVVEWFPIAEALRRLSYPNEARVVDKAQQVLGP